jgi:hypothetical protein
LAAILEQDRSIRSAGWCLTETSYQGRTRPIRPSRDRTLWWQHEHHLLYTLYPTIFLGIPNKRVQRGHLQLAGSKHFEPMLTVSLHIGTEGPCELPLSASVDACRDAHIEMK